MARTAHTSEDDLLIWLALRLRGLGEIDDLAAIHGLSVEQTERALDELTRAGHCQLREVGGLPKFLLTPSGREDGETALAAELDGCGARDAVTEGYEQFLALNPVMLRLCTDWQVIGADATDATDAPATLNDHTDPDYDARILRRLDELHAQICTVLDGLAAVMGRYANYVPRLAAAQARLAVGDLDYLTKPLIPSYHTVWFELHEDLLATLGIDRASEAAR